MAGIRRQSIACLACFVVRDNAAAISVMCLELVVILVKRQCQHRMPGSGLYSRQRDCSWLVYLECIIILGA